MKNRSKNAAMQAKIKKAGTKESSSVSKMELKQLKLKKLAERKAEKEEKSKLRDNATILEVNAHKKKASPPVDPDVCSEGMEGVKDWFESLIHPADPEMFLEEIWTKRALKVGHQPPQSQNQATANEANPRSRVTDDDERYTSLLQNYMHDLDLESLLQNTPSDNVFIWFRGGECAQGSDSSEKPPTAHSAEVSSEDAFRLWKSVPAASALYFRAPDNLEAPTLTAFARALGMDFGGFASAALTGGGGEYREDEEDEDESSCGEDDMEGSDEVHM